MRWLKILRLQLRSFISYAQVDQELNEELAYHLERLTEEFIASGMNSQEAHLAARRSLRDIEVRKEDCRDLQAFRWLHDLTADLRFSLRSWFRVPVFAVTSILTIALSVGATTAMFGLLDALLLRPLPVSNPHRLVRIASLEKNGVNFAVPGPALDSLRHDPLLAGVCGVQTPLSNVTVGDETFPVGAHALTGDCYSTLGIHSALGRLLTPADDLPNGPRVAVLSYDFWQNRFAGSPSILGKTIRIEGEPFTIIGVTEPQFKGLLLGFPPAVSFPISQLNSDDKSVKSVFYWAAVLARLKPGVSADQLRARLRSEWQRLLDNSLPSDRFNVAQKSELLAMPPLVSSGFNGIDFMLRDRLQQPAVGLLAISILALLVACMNLANLLLARGLDRRREMAIRLALGAKRTRLVRQLFSESLLLMLVGFSLALVVSIVAERWLLAALSSRYIGLSIEAQLNPNVLLFTAGCSLLALLLFGLLPAWQTSDIDSAANLKVASRSVKGGNLRSRRLLIFGQVALTMVLVMAASVFIQNLQSVHHQTLGFQTEGVLDAQLLPLPGRLVQKQVPLPYFTDFLEVARTLPGVEAASLSSFSPLLTHPYKEDVRRLDSSDSPVVEAPAEFISDGFLKTMKIPLLVGRDFSLSSARDSQKTTIISESLAKRLFNEVAPLGRHIRFGSETETFDLEIIGVVADARLEDPRAKDLSFLYLNLWQTPDQASWGNLQLRYSGTQAPLILALKKALQQGGRQYYRQVRDVSDQFEVSIFQERMLAVLGTSFGLLGLLLAAIGLFGLLSFFVATRTSEIGLRIALGAGPGAICWLVVREALILSGAGVVMGLPLCLASSRALGELVPGIAPTEFVPLVLACSILVGAAGLATLIPAYRISTVDPAVALRVE